MEQTTANYNKYGEYTWEQEKYGIDPKLSEQTERLGALYRGFKTIIQEFTIKHEDFRDSGEEQDELIQKVCDGCDTLSSVIVKLVDIDIRGKVI